MKSVLVAISGAQGSWRGEGKAREYEKKYCIYQGNLV